MTRYLSTQTYKQPCRETMQPTCTYEGLQTCYNKQYCVSMSRQTITVIIVKINNVTLTWPIRAQ